MSSTDGTPSMEDVERTVGVVIPTIGRPSLRNAVVSVVQQSLPTDIVVVLDKPDAIGAVQTMLDGYAYRLIVTHGGAGGAAARNLGLFAVSSRYVAYLDDDDVWHQDKLRQQLSALERCKFPDRTLVVTRTAFRRDSKPTRVLPIEPYIVGKSIADYLVQRRDFFYGRTFMQTSSIFGPTQLLQDFPWDEALPKHQDWDLLTRLLSDCSVELIQLGDPLVEVFQGSTHSVSRKADWRASKRWFDKHKPNLSPRGRADFLTVHILRAALQARDFSGIRCYLANVIGSRPHFFAMIVGLSGAIRR